MSKLEQGKPPTNIPRLPIEKLTGSMLDDDFAST